MKKPILIIFLIFFIFSGTAQNPAEIDPTFNTEGWFGVTGQIKKIAHKANGKIIVCGNINFYKGVPVNNIFCLNVDGSLDGTFDPGTTFSKSVNTFAIQPDGKIIVAGSSQLNRVFKRLNQDGTVDINFNTESQFNSVPECIAIQTDGKIVVGGNNNFYNNINFNPILRLNSDGSLDTSFSTNQPLASVYSILIEPTGNIIIGGDSQNSIIDSCVKRLSSNGTLDNTFSSIVRGRASTLSIQNDGKIIIGGDLTSIASTLNYNIIRINSNGLQDTTFSSGIANLVNDIAHVYASAIQQDGKILIGGYFSLFNQSPANNIVRLNTDGTVDNSFNSGIGFNYFVNSLEIHSNGTFFTGGDFTYYDTTNADSIVLLNSNGNINPTFDIGNTAYTQITLTTFCAQTDGKIIVGGNFNHYNNLVTNSLARLNSDGSIDTSFNIGSGFKRGTGFTTSTSAIAQQSDGKIIVGGQFNSYNGTSVLNLVRINSDGSLDTSFTDAANFYGWVNLIVILSDGKILVAGLRSGNSYEIVRLDQNGSLDSSFSSTVVFNSQLTTIKLQPDGKIIIGGSFSTFNSITAPGIIRLNSDGTIDTAFISGTGFNTSNNVRTIALQQNGKIIVGGYLRNYNGVTTLKNLVRLNNDGTIDLSFNIGTGFNSTVASVDIDLNEKIIIGGFFTSFNSTSSNRFIGLNNDGTIDSQFNIGSGFDSVLFKLNILPDRKIIVSGGFSSYDGVVAKQIIRLKGNGVLGTQNNSLINKMSFYPNPVKDILQLKLDDFIIVKAYTIFSSSGKEIKSKTTLFFDNKINLMGLSKGIYLLKVETNHGQLTAKFIKE